MSLRLFQRSHALSEIVNREGEAFEDGGPLLRRGVGVPALVENVRPLAVAGDDQAAAFEFLCGAAGGVHRDPVCLHDLRQGRDLVPWLVLAGVDLPLEIVGHLDIGRSAVRSIDAHSTTLSPERL